MGGRNRLAIHLVGEDDGHLPRRGFQNLAQRQRALKWGQVLGVIALIIDAADILLGPGQPDDFTEGDPLPQTHVKRIGAVGAGADVQEADRVLLRQSHQAIPVQGVAQRPREGLLHAAVARRVRDHLEGPGLRNESDLAQPLRREFGDARFPLVQDVGAVMAGSGTPAWRWPPAIEGRPRHWQPREEALQAAAAALPN